MQFTDTEKIAILKNVDIIVNADGVIHDKEKIFVLQLLNAFNLSIDYVAYKAKLMSLPMSASIIKIMNSEKKEEAKNIIIAASLADGNLDPTELGALLAMFDAFE